MTRVLLPQIPDQLRNSLVLETTINPILHLLDDLRLVLQRRFDIIMREQQRKDLLSSRIVTLHLLTIVEICQVVETQFLACTHINDIFFKFIKWIGKASVYCAAPVEDLALSGFGFGMRLGIWQVLMHYMAVALDVGLVDNRRIGGIKIFKDIARIFAMLDGLHDYILVDLRPCANCHYVVVVDDHILIEIDHQLIYEDSYGDRLTFNAEDVARLVDDYQVLVLLGIHLEIIEEWFLCPLVLFEQDAIWVWVADFS